MPNKRLYELAVSRRAPMPTADIGRGERARWPGPGGHGGHPGAGGPGHPTADHTEEQPRHRIHRDDRLARLVQVHGQRRRHRVRRVQAGPAGYEGGREHGGRDRHQAHAGYRVRLHDRGPRRRRQLLAGQQRGDGHHQAVDKTPPTVPTNLHSTGQTGTTITLAWNASRDNAGGIGLAGYDVYLNGGTTPVASSDTPGVTVGNLTPNTTYTFTVRARDLANNRSGPSNTASARTHGGGGGIGAVTTIATDKDVPWGLAFLPNGDGIYTERDAQTVIELSPNGTKTTLGKIPGVSGTNGEGGLMGLELSPNFASDHWVYIMHTSSSDNRVIRLKLNGK